MIANFVLHKDHKYETLTKLDQFEIGHFYIILAKVGSITLLYSFRHYRGWFKYA
jgi:hypothetical protein